MKKSKNKILYLLVGAFIGFIIAWSIIWWQSYNKNEWKIFNKIKTKFSNFFDFKNRQNVTFVNENIDKQKAYNSKNAPKVNTKLKNDSAFYDTTNINLYDPNALDEFLSIYNGQLPDSLLIDSILKSQNNIDINTYNTSDNTPVKKDKLIYAKAYTIQGIEQFFNDESDEIDSILTDNKTSTPNKLKNILRVEFWKSPINYKGYKIGKHKLVLFGIEQFDVVSFKISNKTLYMKYFSDFYQIDNSPEYKSLVSVSNQNLHNQINK